MKSNVMISLPTNLNDELKEIAKELKLTKSSLITQAIDYYLDMLDLRLAEQRAKSGGKTYSLDEVKAMINE